MVKNAKGVVNKTSNMAMSQGASMAIAIIIVVIVTLCIFGGCFFGTRQYVMRDHLRTCTAPAPESEPEAETSSSQLPQQNSDRHSPHANLPAQIREDQTDRTMEATSLHIPHPLAALQPSSLEIKKYRKGPISGPGAMYGSTLTTQTRRPLAGF